VKPDTNDDVHVIVASGPYMPTGSTQTPMLTQLIEVVKAKNAQVLVLVIFRNRFKIFNILSFHFAELSLAHLWIQIMI
jgi:hypothetical protein